MSKITGLFVYPVKSCAAMVFNEGQLESGGLRHDRAWVIVSARGKVLTQRDHPGLALIQTGVDADGDLMLKADTFGEIKVPSLAAGCGSRETLQIIDIWADKCGGIDQGDKVAAWLSEFLKVDCRLFRSEPLSMRAREYARWGPPQPRTGTGKFKASMAFVDSCPLLVVFEESLNDLNGRLVDPVPMSRFRPSIVIAGAAAYAEDEIEVIETAGAKLHRVKPCSRCVIVTIDQLRGAACGKEPLATLSSYRLVDGKVNFGTYFAAESDGRLAVGDATDLSRVGFA